MKVLNKIGDAYATSITTRDRIMNALEAGGLTIALQSETGLIIMEEIVVDDEEIDEEG